METAPDEDDFAIGRQMTLREWTELPEDVSGEWVDGWVVEEEVTTFAHERVVAWLMVRLDAWLTARGGAVFGSEAKFVLGPTRGRKPDLSAWFSANLPDGDASYADQPPDLMVEIVSRRARDVRRDRIEKVAEYAAFGVRRYVLVDPEARTFEALELAADRRYLVALVATGGRIEIPGCPGLVLDLDALWAEVDRLTGAV